MDEPLQTRPAHAEQQAGKILVLPRYSRMGASSRLRFEAYFPALQDAGLAVESMPLLDDAHVRSLYTGRSVARAGLVGAYLKRFGRLLRHSDCDLVWIEKEVFPWVPRIEELLLGNNCVRYVLDIDDAWFLRYAEGGRFGAALRGKLERIARGAALVVAANTVLADWARGVGCTRVEVIPTVVDPDRYPVAAHEVKDRVRVVWIGTPMTLSYLEPVVPILTELASSHAIELVVVGGGEGLQFPPSLPVSHLPWSEASEGDALASCDIGLMYLPDGAWERGKSAYKLIQCMAAGLPVVASPVGANTELVVPEVGLLAATPGEWRDALSALMSDRSRRRITGHAGRARIERDYSVHVWGKRLADLFWEQIEAERAARPG